MVGWSMSRPALPEQLLLRSLISKTESNQASRLQEGRCLKRKEQRSQVGWRVQHLSLQPHASCRHQEELARVSDIVCMSLAANRNN
ncbi:hypothetical protein KCU98_g31, partial [Aureobasidium melanogenum]